MLLYSTDSAVRPGYAGVPPAGTPWGRRHPARRHTLGARASRPQRPGVRGRPRPQARPGCAGIPPAGTPWGRRRPRPQAHPGGAGILPTGTPWVRGRPARNALGGAGVLARRHALGAQASSPAGMPWVRERPRPLAHPGHAGIPPAGTPWARRRPACLGTLGARASPPASPRPGYAGVSLVCAFPPVNQATLRCIIKQPEDNIACRITVLRLTPAGFRRQGKRRSHRGRFFGNPLRAISRFRHQNVQNPPSPLVG